MYSLLCMPVKYHHRASFFYRFAIPQSDFPPSFPIASGICAPRPHFLHSKWPLTAAFHFGHFIFYDCMKELSSLKNHIKSPGFVLIFRGRWGRRRHTHFGNDCFLESRKNWSNPLNDTVFLTVPRVSFQSLQTSKSFPHVLPPKKPTQPNYFQKRPGWLWPISSVEGGKHHPSSPRQAGLRCFSAQQRSHSRFFWGMEWFKPLVRLKLVFHFLLFLQTPSQVEEKTK